MVETKGMLKEDVMKSLNAVDEVGNTKFDENFDKENMDKENIDKENIDKENLRETGREV